MASTDLHNKFIDLEWQQRHRMAAGTNHSSSDDDTPSPWSRVDGSAQPDIMRRNRYLNVEPFASNRVRLRVPKDKLDYINASPIVLKQTVSGVEKRYIATQGPKDETTSHMWLMLLAETGHDSDPAVVVMLTQTHESGKEKCAQYYPLDMEHSTMVVAEDTQIAEGFSGTLTLKSIKEDEESHSTIRQLELTAKGLPPAPVEADVAADVAANGSDTPMPDEPPAPQEQDPIPTITKPVYHLLFSGWPDFLIPEGPDRAALVHLVALSARLNGAESTHPRIVHCSAGVGRSGTFIALDYLLSEIADGAWDDLCEFGEQDSSPTTALDDAAAATILDTPGARDSMILTGAGRARDPVLEVVDALRKQRMMMVQGEGQFCFLYDVCREVWVERQRTRSQEEGQIQTQS